MPDRWDEEDELDRGRGRGRSRLREPEPEPTLGELIEGSVRKLVTGLVIAGGLIGLGVYASRGGDPSVDYQITSTPDGTVYRLDSERGRIVACQNRHCWRLLQDSDDIERTPPAQNNAAALPPPAQTQQPQTTAAQQSQAQLPAPQNQAAPATR